MLNIEQFKRLVLLPTLNRMGAPFASSPAVVNLLLGTAAHESGFQHIAQIGGGPALGLYQMEPATHDWLAKDWVSRRPGLAQRILTATNTAGFDVGSLVDNLAYATAFCRLRYYAVPEALPPNDPVALARYWKRHYNTPGGAGTVEQWLYHYSALVARWTD